MGQEVGLLEKSVEMLRPLGRLVLNATRRRRDVRVVSFDDLYGDVDCSPVIQPLTIDTPELVEMPLVPGVAHYRQARYTTPRMYVAVLNDVLYCPFNNVVLTDDGAVLADAMSTIRRPEYLDHYALSVRRVLPLPGTHTAFRSRFNHYYHALIDHAPRLFALGLPEAARFGKIGLLLRDGPTAFERYLFDRMAPSYLYPVTLKRRVLYRVERLVFVSFMTRRHAPVYPRVYLNYFDRTMLPDRPRKRHRRIFITRAGTTKGRHIVNEDEVMALLSQYGFHRYALEDLSYQEQADLFYDAEAVVAAHGAGLTNLIYAQEARVLEYFASPHVVPSFYFLSRMRNHRYRYRCASGDWRDDDFAIDMDRLRDDLPELLTDN